MTDDDAAKDPDVVALLQLIAAIETELGYATVEHLRTLAHAELSPSMRKSLRRELERLVRRDLVLADNRQRLTRTNRLVAIRLYRLNRRHPGVVQALAGRESGAR